VNDNIAIKIDNVSKRYKLYDSPQDRMKEALHPFRKKYHKDFYALKDISLEVKKGEILGIVGRNGSGKSTLLKIIAGVLSPTTGTVQTHGRVSAILELSAGFNSNFTGLENIYHNLSINGFRKKEIDQKVEEIIDFSELGQFINQPVKTYSSGMKAKLAFAVSTSVDPDILILDEVLSVGDALFKRKCFARMEQFFNGGKTVIYVSHSTQSVISICSNAILLDKGRIMNISDPKSISKEYNKLLFGEDGSRKKKEQPYEVEIKTDTKANIINFSNTFIDMMNFSVINQKGIETPLLETNNIYRITFDLLFKNSFNSIAISVVIKDIKGIFLTGARFPNLKDTMSVNNNSTIRICFNFNCILLPGEYFIDIGVPFFEMSEKGSLLHLIDYYQFKVQTIKEINWGIFHAFNGINVQWK
jgi:ABC-type polysaccharide/polyol phosphate transport system ATPase subunit